MEYRRLGQTSLSVSELALGSMQFGWTVNEAVATSIMDTYAEAGGNLIDTADVYSNWADGNPGGVSEEIIGRWLKARGNRAAIVLATKVRGRMWDGPDGEGLGRAHIVAAVEASLRRLQTDYIDLYLTHWFDEDTPIEETMRALDDLVRSGKVRYVGCSNHPAWRLVEALWSSDKHGLTGYSTLQPHYNLVHREEFEKDLCEVTTKYKLGVFPYSPLEGGFLTGKYRQEGPMPTSARANRIRDRYFSERNFALLDTLEGIGERYGQGIPQIALAWLLTNPAVTSPIIGANSVAQVKASLAAAGLRLTEEEMQTLNQMSSWQDE